MAVIVSSALYLDMVEQSQARFDSVLNSLETLYRSHMKRAGIPEAKIDAFIERLRVNPDLIPRSPH